MRNVSEFDANILMLVKKNTDGVCVYVRVKAADQNIMAVAAVQWKWTVIEWKSLYLK